MRRRVRPWGVHPDAVPGFRGEIQVVLERRHVVNFVAFVGMVDRVGHLAHEREVRLPVREVFFVPVGEPVEELRRVVMDRVRVVHGEPGDGPLVVVRQRLLRSGPAHDVLEFVLLLLEDLPALGIVGIVLVLELGLGLR